MLTSIMSTLPASWQPYAKAYAAALLSALTTLAAVLDAVPQWVTIVVALLSAPAVFAVPNLDPNAEKQDESVQPPESSVGDSLGDAVQGLTDGVQAAGEGWPEGTVWIDPSKPTDEEPKPQGGYWGGV